MPAKTKSLSSRGSTYVPAWGQCRFCKETAPQSEMMKYGVRHHAHAVCLYRNRGIGAIDELHTWQLRHLPIVAMMGAGVTLEQVRAWQARIASDDAERAAQELTRTRMRDGAGASATVSAEVLARAASELRSLLGRRPSRDQNTLGAARKVFLSVDDPMNTDD